MSAAVAPAGLAEALEALRDELEAAELGAELSGVERARRARRELVDQVGDYLLPRLRRMDAPLLMVVGGSTGAGKSTLVNSLVGATVSPAGVLRPTTRSPVLACHPDDLGWFEDDRVLPALSRASGEPAAAGDLRLHAHRRAAARASRCWTRPDVDSVVAANRLLAKQLLAAADAWLFVTTAARYADAVPWDLLHGARDRGTALCLVLNRVPPGAGPRSPGTCARCWPRRASPRRICSSSPRPTLEDGLLPAADLAPVRAWLDALTADAQARAELVRRTLAGALDSLPARAEAVAATVEEQQGGGRGAARRPRHGLRAGPGRRSTPPCATARCCAARCSRAGTTSSAPATCMRSLEDADRAAARPPALAGHRRAARPTRSCAARSRRASTRSCTPPPTAPPSAPRPRGASGPPDGRS